MELRTKRLIIRKPKVTDTKDLVEGLNEKTISQGINGMPYPYKTKDGKKWVERTKKEWKQKKPTRISFVIELKKEKKVVGGICMNNIDRENKKAETVSWVSKNYRRRKIITEAKIALNDYAFNTLKLIRIYSIIQVTNKKSQKVQKKAGYKKEGLLRNNRVLKSGKPMNQQIHGLLKEDWQKTRKKLIKEINDHKKNER